jgi:hypothetical protein
MESIHTSEKKRTRFQLDESTSDNDINVERSMATTSDTTHAKKSDPGPLMPQTVSILNNILAAIATNLDKGVREDKMVERLLRTDNASQTPNPAVQNFTNEVEHAKTELLNNLKQFSDSELKNNVQNGMFNAFKELRTEVSTWYRSVAHYKKSELRDSTTPRSLIQLTVRFSPAVLDTALIDKITDMYKACTQKLTYDLEVTVIDRLRDMQKTLMAKWTKVTSHDEKFMWAKVYKTVLRNNKERGASARPRYTDNDGESSPNDEPPSDSRRGQRRGRRPYRKRGAGQPSDRSGQPDDTQHRQRGRHYRSERTDSDDSTRHRRHSEHGLQRDRHERHGSDYLTSTTDDDEFIPRRRRTSSRQWRNKNFSTRNPDVRASFRQIP